MAYIDFSLEYTTNCLQTGLVNVFANRGQTHKGWNHTSPLNNNNNNDNNNNNNNNIGKSHSKSECVKLRFVSKEKLIFLIRLSKCIINLPSSRKSVTFSSSLVLPLLLMKLLLWLLLLAFC